MVAGVPDASRGQSVAAYIIPADASLTAQELGAWCARCDDLSAYKCPRYYRFVDTLPYNATGKKQHVLLQTQAEDPPYGKPYGGPFCRSVCYSSNSNSLYAVQPVSL